MKRNPCLQWRPIPGFENLYEINRLGTIRSMHQEKRYRQVSNKKHYIYTKTKINNCGYVYVRLSKAGKIHTSYIHRLLAQTYLPNPLHRPEVNHIDGK